MQERDLGSGIMLNMLLKFLKVPTNLKKHTKIRIGEWKLKQIID